MGTHTQTQKSHAILKHSQQIIGSEQMSVKTQIRREPNTEHVVPYCDKLQEPSSAELQHDPTVTVTAF